MNAVEKWDQELLHDGEVRIVASRWRTAGHLALTLPFVAGGVWMWSDPDGVVELLLGALGTVFFGLGLVLFPWRIVRPVSFVVTPAGVRYRSREYAWNDLVGVSSYSVASTDLLLLLLTGVAAERVASSSSPLKRTLMRRNEAMIGGPNVSIPGPFRHHAELVGWLEATRRRHGSRSSRRGQPGSDTSGGTLAVMPPDGGARPD
ncbi:STM3941 family protein [Isoptericola sediminis]|uniref:Uncharacterized protein n=1 Tax=Isoptericola sediminis TaxID=2733572 RepID=A0A849JVI8_9MICO|nr:STM3941 family protein [Isoptericola sediminis]NNU27322.1 hypothetical protein [Isoptericola sediminis]